MTQSRWRRVYVAQIRSELLKLSRMRVYMLLLLVAPVLLYSASAANPRVPDIEGIPGRIYLIANFGMFALFGTALFGFGLGLATERAQGWTRTLNTAPISPWTPMLAKLVVCMILSSAALGLLLIVAALAFGVRLPLTSIALLFVTMIGCSIPLGSIGLALGAWLGANSAPLVMILIYMIISSMSGIVVPLEMIARGNLALVYFAPIFPTFHAGQLALAVLRPSLPGIIPLHIIALAAYSVGFLIIAALGNRRNAAQSYG
jgi:ABC-2 type transport system permease protein